MIEEISFKNVLSFRDEVTLSFEATQEGEAPLGVADYLEDLLTNPYNPSRTIDSFMPYIWHKQP